MNIKNLIDYSKPGIWGFFNEKDKRFFISYSNNILSSVSRNITQIQDKSHSCRKLIRDLPHLNLVLFVDDALDTKSRKIRTMELINAFISKGYTPYINRTLVSYKLRMVITNEYNIHVLLINKRNDKIIVGVFDSINEANSFINSNYPNNKITKIIYSENSLSKEFFKRKGFKV